MKLTHHNQETRYWSFDRIVNYIIIAYAFTLPISKAGNVLFSHLLILFFIFHFDYRHAFQQIKRSRLIISLFAFVGFSLVAVLWSSDKLFALLYVKKYYHLLTLPIIYLYFNPVYLRQVFSSFLLAMLISILMMYGIFFELIHYKDIPATDPSPFVNHSNFSMFIAFALVIIYYRITEASNKTGQIVYSIFFILALSALFVSGGRTGQIAFFIMLLGFMLYHTKNKLKAVVGTTILSAVILGIALISSPVIHDRLAYTYTDIKQTLVKQDFTHSFGIRVSLWLMGSHLFMDNFFTGTGIGDTKEGMQKYAKKYNIKRYLGWEDKGDIDYHSLYVHYAVQLGIIGLLLIINLMYQMFKINFASDKNRILHLMLAILLLVFSTVGNILHTIEPMTFYAFFLGIMTALSRHETKGN